MHPPRILATLTLVAALGPVALTGQGGISDLPLKHAGGPTTAGITAADLMTRLYIFADDSMMGRAVGTEDNIRATAYIEREVRRLGLQPAGENGSYFQDLPIATRRLDPASELRVGNTVLRAGTDFVASGSGTPNQLRNAAVVFGGMIYDTVALPRPGSWDDKVVVFTSFKPPAGFDGQAFGASEGYRRFQALVRNATVATVTGDSLPAGVVRNAMASDAIGLVRDGAGSMSLALTAGAATALLGQRPDDARRGLAGKRVTSDIRFIETPVPLGRNVVAILPGSDPTLRDEYVAIGAHNDHVGYNRNPVDHDSVWAFNRLIRPQGAENRDRPPTAEETPVLRAMIDSLRRIRPPRQDSIRNGADDDGSGSMALLEIAEDLVRNNVTPKRSILFVWHAGEERGMWGSQFYTDHPTVPRESIVAQLNVDMIGRGGPGDITGIAKGGGLLHGDARYLQVLGSRRLSTELGDIIDAVNGIRPQPLRLDYAMDAAGHPQNIYCRSDHYEYARYGIPIAFFTTGGHADYHQITDEPQYIRYDHFAEVTRFIRDVTLSVADLDHRPAIDHEVPDRSLGCRQ